MMTLNHAANCLDAMHFETVVEMLKTKLGFVELRRTGAQFGFVNRARTSTSSSAEA